MSKKSVQPQRRVKEWVDRIVAGILLLLLSPLLLLIVVLIKIDDGGPVFFRQERVGRGEQSFRIWKFRTMVPDADALLDGNGRVREDRITRVGKFLRPLSVDELPQLVNVLRGEMSIVGPRPVVWEHLPRYSRRQRRRFLMRPGITGLAQVNGRNTITWSRRLELDVAYVESFSLWLDLLILAKTIPVVLFRRGLVLDRNPEYVDDLPSGDRVP